MARTYYVLAEKHGIAFGVWAVAFGDYDKDCVAFERDEMHESAGVPYSSLNIIRTTDKQADIDAAIDALNGKAN